jgi:DNA repair exonuclease SbcCD ATPase subunit
MEFKFTVEQIVEIVRAARALASGFTEEHLQWLISAQKRLAESGFCEAVWALVRLEREMGVSISKALDAAKRLVRNNANLEAANARLEQKNVTLHTANQELEQRHQQLMEATGQARVELAAVKAETEKEKRRLVALREEAEREKKRIDQEVEEYRRKASVTEQEVATAGQLKAEVARSGFSLELMLDLSKEFAGHKDAKDRLAEELKTHGTLTGYVTALEKQTEEKKAALNSELASLRAQADRERIYAKKLEEARYSLESTITQLQADVAHEQELRRFYEDYHDLSRFLDCLASWDQVAFMRCNNPVSALANALNPSAMAHFCTDKAPVKCPHCGAGFIADAQAYQALNMPLGSWVKFRRGE